METGLGRRHDELLLLLLLLGLGLLVLRPADGRRLGVAARELEPQSQR